MNAKIIVALCCKPMFTPGRLQGRQAQNVLDRDAEPNLKKAVGDIVGGFFLRMGDSGFRQYIKGLTKGNDQFAALPGAVRNHEIEKAPFFARLLLFEETLRILCEFEKLHALVHVGFVRNLMALCLAEAASLLRPPIRRHPTIEVDVYFPVELIDIDRFEALLQALLLGLEGRDSRLVLTLFGGMAGVESLSDPIEDLAVEPISPPSILQKWCSSTSSRT